MKRSTLTPTAIKALERIHPDIMRILVRAARHYSALRMNESKDKVRETVTFAFERVLEP